MSAPAPPVRNLGRRRLVTRLMASPLTLPALGVAGFLAVVAGIQLGNSAVGAIDPVYFRGAAVHPRDRGAALDERELEAARLARRATAYNELYGWDEGRAARLADCQGCSMTRVAAGDYSALVPYFGSREERRADEARERNRVDALYEKREDEAAEQREARADHVARYLDFPVAEPAVQVVEPAAPELARPARSGTDDAYPPRRLGSERARPLGVLRPRERDAHPPETARDRLGEDSDVDVRRGGEGVGESFIAE